MKGRKRSEREARRGGAMAARGREVCLPVRRRTLALLWLSSRPLCVSKSGNVVCGS